MIKKKELFISLAAVGLFFIVMVILFPAEAQVAITEEHPNDVVSLLKWAAIGLGSLVLLLIVYIWKSSQSAMVKALDGIRSEVRITNVTLKEIEKDFRTEVGLLTVRVNKMEARCEVVNAELASRRSTDE